MTPDQAIFRCRAKIEGLVFPAAPAKKLKTRGMVDIMELMRFQYVYSRKFKQYFLFIDAYSGEDIEQDDYDSRYNVMELYAIRGSQPVFLEEFNIVMNAPVFSSPATPWYTFGDGMSFHGNEGTYNKLLEAEWRIFVEANNIVCSDEIVISDSESESDLNVNLISESESD